MRKCYSCRLFVCLCVCVCVCHLLILVVVTLKTSINGYGLKNEILQIDSFIQILRISRDRERPALNIKYIIHMARGCC